MIEDAGALAKDSSGGAIGINPVQPQPMVSARRGSRKLQKLEQIRGVPSSHNTSNTIRSLSGDLATISTSNRPNYQDRGQMKLSNLRDHHPRRDDSEQTCTKVEEARANGRTAVVTTEQQLTQESTRTPRNSIQNVLANTALSFRRHQHPLAHQQNDDNNLAVASLVPELDLPMAEELDTAAAAATASARKGQIHRRYWGFIALIGLVLLLLVLAIALGVSLGSSKDSSPTNNTPSSAIPTVAPTTWQEGYVQSLLPSYTLQAIEIPGTPQALAYNFMLQDANLSSYPEWKTKQRFALATFFHATSGPTTWLQTNGWLTTQDECSWDSRKSFVIPDSALARSDVQYDLGFGSISSPCNEQGRYIHLWQWGNGLNGTLPPELFFLTSLQSINLVPQVGARQIQESNDVISFPLAKENYLHGSVPTEIGLCSDLKAISMQQNQLTGTLPTLVGQLSHLIYFQLSQNEISGALPSFDKATSMAFLDLQFNKLQGRIPWSSLWSMTNLSTLHLARNAFNGTIPSEVAALSSLTSLRLFGNELTGPIPTSIGRLSSLTRLMIDSNNLVGRIPTELGRLTNLELLHLSGNTLNATIPSEVGRLTRLRTFRIFRNELTGSIPMDLRTLTQMTFFPLHHNRLTGTIPPEILEDLSNLESMWLYDNQLSGTIPTQLGLLTNMTDIDFQNNLLTGPIPSEIGNLARMSQDLWLGRNILTGSVPSEIGRLSSLGKLYLDRNQLTGAIPSTVGAMSGLRALVLENNRLFASIPTQLGLLSSKLEFLFVGFNALTGSIPSEIGQLSALQHLVLSNNMLSGKLPATLLDLIASPDSNITEIDIRGNDGLFGTIPADVCSRTLQQEEFQLLLTFDCGDSLCGCDCSCPS
jgi:Leucine-rich repeat (LRR) protein